MPNPDDSLTPDERAHLYERAARINVDVADPDKPLAALQKHGLAVSDVVRLIRSLMDMGLIPRTPGPVEAIRAARTPVFSYLLSVAQLELQEKKDQQEYALALHVTSDLIMLSRAEELDKKFGLRPVTMAEFDAQTAVYLQEHPQEGAPPTD